MNWLWSNQKKVLDKDKVFLKIQFLTQSQKVKKDLAIGQLIQKFQDDEETIVPFEEYFSCSYRFVLNAKQAKLQANQKQQITLKNLIGNIILSTNQQTRHFYEDYVNGIQVVMQNNQALANNDLINLYDEREVSMYVPQQVIQIVYNQKSFWERLKKKTTQTIKSIPSIVAKVIQKLIGFVLVLLGLNGGVSSLIWKAIPYKMIIQWIGLVVSMFFPALGPILGISKLLL